MKDQDREFCSLHFAFCAGSYHTYHIHMYTQCPDVHMCLSSPSAAEVFILARQTPSRDLSGALLPKEMRSKTKAMLVSGRKSLGTLTSHVEYINFNHPRISSWKPSTGDWAKRKERRLFLHRKLARLKREAGQDKSGRQFLRGNTTMGPASFWFKG